MIIGRGWIGKKMAALTGLPLVSHESALVAISGLKPEIVINCAGMTGVPNVDACEKSKAETIEANALFPVKVWQECSRVGARMAHFSTGCIFQGDGDYREDDAPNYDASTYSAAKLISDRYLSDRAWIFRIRMPFDGTDSPRSLLTKLEGYARHGKLIDGLNSISDADEMVGLAWKLIQDRVPLGPYHMVNTGAITTQEIASIMKLDADWMGWDEFHQRGNGARSVCTLSNEKLRRYAYVNPVHRAVDFCAEQRRHLHAA